MKRICSYRLCKIAWLVWRYRTWISSHSWKKKEDRGWVMHFSLLLAVRRVLSLISSESQWKAMVSKWVWELFVVRKIVLSTFWQMLLKSNNKNQRSKLNIFPHWFPSIMESKKFNFKWVTSSQKCRSLLIPIKSASKLCTLSCLYLLICSTWVTLRLRDKVKMEKLVCTEL